MYKDYTIVATIDKTKIHLKTMLLLWNMLEYYHIVGPQIMNTWNHVQKQYALAIKVIKAINISYNDSVII